MEQPKLMLHYNLWLGFNEFSPVNLLFAFEFNHIFVVLCKFSFEILERLGLCCFSRLTFLQRLFGIQLYNARASHTI